MNNRKEEQQYKQLRRLAQQLHIPIPEAFWELEVRDKEGKVIQHLKQRSHSWVRNAYNLLASQLMAINGSDSTWGGGYINLKDQTGVVRSSACLVSVYGGPANIEQIGFGYRGAAGDDTGGIQVGSGTNAESFEDYVLQTKIANGTGAGQLSYVAGDAVVKSYNDVSKVYQAQHVRYFNNNSGGNVSVNEVALVDLDMAVGTSKYKTVTSRDKLAATITIPNTGQLKVTYTIQLTYPA